MRPSKYDWEAIRADAATLTTDELVEKYAIPPGTLSCRKYDDRRAGKPWPKPPKAPEAPSRVNREFVHAHASPAASKSSLEHRRAQGERRAERGEPVPAGMAPGLEPVPASLTRLPWAKYPRDPRTAVLIAELLDNAARGEFVKGLGSEAIAFFTSHAAYLRAVAERAKAQAT